MRRPQSAQLRLTSFSVEWSLEIALVMTAWSSRRGTHGPARSGQRRFRSNKESTANYSECRSNRIKPSLQFCDPCMKDPKRFTYTCLDSSVRDHLLDRQPGEVRNVSRSETSALPSEGFVFALRKAHADRSFSSVIGHFVDRSNLQGVASRSVAHLVTFISKSSPTRG